MAKAYNKHVVAKPFQIGDLVWKTILPLGTQKNRFVKWSPSTKIVPGNAYFVESLEGVSLPKPLNGRYLRRFYPSIW
jgi:hypothetical protein